MVGDLLKHRPREHQSQRPDEIPGGRQLLPGGDASLVQAAVRRRILVHLRAVERDDSAVERRPEIPLEQFVDVRCEEGVVFGDENCVCVFGDFEEVAAGLYVVAEITEDASRRMCEKRLLCLYFWPLNTEVIRAVDATPWLRKQNRVNSCSGE